jgi:hypothetical protein
MRMPFGLVAALAAVVLAGSSASAQSLGEVAERNKQKEKKGAKVYTETDLRGRPGPNLVSQPGTSEAVAAATPADAEKKPDGTAAAPAGTPGAPAAEKPKTEEELREEAQKAWQERKAKAEADVARHSATVAKLETALGDLTGPLYGGNRTAQLNQIDEAKRLLAAAQQSLADITEEGRRQRYR